MGASAAPRTGGAGGAPAPINFQGGPLSYDVVVAQTPAFNSTVYVGNLIPYTTQADLIPLFQVRYPFPLRSCRAVDTPLPDLASFDPPGAVGLRLHR
jgi:hypothetical protein